MTRVYSASWAKVARAVLWITIQDAAAINWKVKPFVGIERDRIRFLDRGEQRAR